MKSKVFLFLAAAFSLVILMCFTGCTSGGSGPLNSSAGAGVSVLSGYVYKPAGVQSKDMKAAQSSGLIASSSRLNDGNYTPVTNATVKREDSSGNSTQTDLNGRFSFSNLSATGEYNIVVDPSTSTNANTYAGVAECFGVYNTSNSSSPAYLKVVPVTTTVPLGKKREFRVIMKDGNADMISPCAVTWSVEGSIGTINSSGIFTAASAGIGKVIATYGELSSFSIVRVPGQSDQTGNLHGFVTDGTNPISNITVKLSGIPEIGITDASGEYWINNVSAGDYNVSASQNGTVMSQTPVTIISGETADCNFVINSTSPPAPISGTVLEVACARFHSLAVKADGTVWAWGWNGKGQLGDGTNTAKSTPVQILNLNNVKAIACGGYGHSLALKKNGTVWAWGWNEKGQVGDGTNIDRKTPAQVLNLNNVIAISAGEKHSIALKSDGTIWAWGYNEYGQLGNGANVDTNIPVQVSNLSNVIDIDGGYWMQSFALKNDGTVWSWGFNGWGSLGDGTYTARNTPVNVINLTGVTAMSGTEHGIAIKSNGTVWSWGANNYYQLGNGTDVLKTNAPGQVSNLISITKLAAGDYHSLALKNDGTVWSWGYNQTGSLGDGTNVNKNVPVQVKGYSGQGYLTNIFLIAAGAHNLVLKSDGTVWAWGSNSWGQLGDGTTTNRNTPVQVKGL